MRRSPRAVALAIAIGALGTGLSLLEPVFALEERLGLGWLFAWRGAVQTPDGAVIARFDADALARFASLPAEISAWPEPLRGCARSDPSLRRLPRADAINKLPRGLPACLLGELRRRAVGAVVFDVVFRPDAERDGGVAGLASAMRAHGGVVLLAAARSELRRGSARGGAVQVDIVEAPQAELAEAAASVATFTLPRGAHEFWARRTGSAYPVQLPLAALAVQADREAELPPPSRAGPALARAQNGPDYYYTNLYGPPGTIPSVSVADLLAPDPGMPPPAIPDLAGRAVFIGYQDLVTAHGPDSFGTPFGSRDGIDLAGVEIAATAYLNLLHDQTLRAWPEFVRLGLIALLGVGFTLAACMGSIWRGLGLPLAVGAGYLATGVAAFALADHWLPVVVPLLVLLPAAIAAGQAHRYLGATGWLRIYVPGPLSARLLVGHAGPVAERREVTVLITDIAGFTTFAERSTPEAVTAFINRHFTLLTRLVEAEGGIVAQFIGDSLFAFWGAPDAVPDHARRACRAALAIAAAMERRNARRIARGQTPVRLRIGVNTGEVLAGNVGAPGRSSYGIVGDAVNTTQRLEQLAKLLCPDRPSAAILVAEATRLHAGPGFGWRDAGRHVVRGRQQEVRIFRLYNPLEPPALADVTEHVLPAMAVADAAA